MTVKTQLKLIAGSALSLMPALASAQELTSEYRLVVWIIGLGVLIAIPIVGMSLLAPYLREKRRAELIEKFLEQGREIPSELLAKPEVPSVPPHELAELIRSRSMRRGVVLLALALGVAVVFYIGTGDPRAAAWGFLFLCLGVACFINAKFFSGVRSPD
jgi:hypothetical protein